MEPEGKIQAKILKYLEKLNNIHTIKTIASNKRGVADILVCYRGRFLSIEVKAKYGKVGKLQDRFKTKINEAGGYAIIAYNVEQVKELIDRVDYDILEGCK